MEKLINLLETLEAKIDLAHVQKVEQLYRETLAYQPVSHLPLTITFPIMDGFTPFPYAEAFNDPAKMLYNELLAGVFGTGVYNSVMLKDHFPLHIRSNHGIGILSSLFGATCKIVNNNMPWVDHLGIAETKKVIRKGVPEFNTALGKKVLETHQFYIENLKQYPKCYQAIRITQPDLQGPFDIAHLLLGNEIFYLVYDLPEMLHELLGIVTETYIGYRRLIEPLLTHEAGEHSVYIHGSIYGGKVLLKDDTALINISGPMYDEFSKPYNEKILAEFKGGSTHYCGPARPWHSESIQNRWLKGINYGNPEMHDLKETYGYWHQYKVPIIHWGYNQTPEHLQQVYHLKITTGITLATQAESLAHARKILERHHQAYSEI